MALTKQVNGKKVQLTAQEEANVRAEWEANQTVQDTQNAVNNAFNSKRIANIEALGTREELMAEINAMTGASSQVKTMIRKLAEIIYSNEKGIID